jgi:oxidoreductase, short-chain dehydrogenase/reductase family
MTAGAGVTHQEFHSKEFSQKGGLFEMVQLWVNLPKAHKNTQPKYQHLPKERIPVVSMGDGEARIIAGEYENTRGAASTFTPLNVWDISIKEDGKITLDLPASHNLSLVVLRGNVIINNSQKASETQLVRFENTSGAVIIKAMGCEAKILLLSGEPIDEPVVGYGPFVMNTKEEINQAIDDYRRGEFGQIPVEN